MRIFKSVLHIRLVSSKEVLRSSSDQRCWIFPHCLKKAQFPWMAAECAPGKIHIDLYLSRCYHLHNAHEISAWQAYQKSQLFSGVTRKSSFLLYPKATRYCYSTESSGKAFRNIWQDEANFQPVKHCVSIGINRPHLLTSASIRSGTRKVFSFIFMRA